MNKKADERWLPYGGWLDIILAGFPIIPVGNKNVITKGRGGKGRMIQKTKEANAFIQNVRLTLYEFSRRLKKDENFSKLLFPIVGKECPIRVDVLYMFDEKDARTMKLSDIENLTKGVFDGIKVGPIYALAGVDFGLIDDDRYITAAYIEKGYAPKDGEGSRIWLRISRAGYRNDHDIAYLLHVLRPFAPYDARNQGLSAKYQKIIKPDSGEVAGVIGKIPQFKKP